MQPAQTEREADVKAVAMEARIRIFGIRPDEAGFPEAADTLGRLWINGEIDIPVAGDERRRTTQYEAGKEYRQIVENYRRSLLIRPLGSSSDLNRSPGHEDYLGDNAHPEYVAWCKRARVKYRGEDGRGGVRNALATCGDPLAQMVIDAVVLEDKIVSGNFIGTLRVALNAVARVTQRREAV